MVNEINISTNTHNKKSVNVSAGTSKIDINLTKDLSAYYSMLAKDWAIKTNGVVENTDYSAKYYANEAASSANEAALSANEASNYSKSSQEIYDGFQQATNDVLSSIETSIQDGVDTINNNTDIAITGIKTEAQKQIQNIESTGFYVRDDKLYFINSKGEEEEFKSGGGGGSVIFDTKLTDHILTYEQSKGWALQGTYVYKEAVAGSRYGYPDFYNKCVDEKDLGTPTETTLGESTVTLYVNANGHTFYDIADKEAIDAWYSIYGIAWYYGVDTENERIFLPRTKWFIQPTGEITEVNTVNEAGLPNITGGFNGYGGDALNANAQGVFRQTTSVTNKIMSSGSGSGLQSFNFDASRSSTIYGNSDTVQPQSINQLLYICVGNTNVESAVTDVVDVTTTENDTMPLFTGMYFDFTPNNVSWLKAGQQANSGGIYTFTYNELVNILNGETKYGDLKVINVADMEVGVDYSEYWKVNQEDMYFITPTAISNKALSGGVMGNGMTLGLTDGTQEGSLAMSSNGLTGWTDYKNPFGTTGGTGWTNSQKSIGVTTDPTKSGIIAEQSTSQLYFKVANAVQNLELLDAGEVMESLTSKADISASNFTAEGKSTISGLSFPSDRYIDLTLNASGSSYTAPANGWFAVAKKTSATNQYVEIGVDFWGMKIIQPVSGNTAYADLPVRKGATVKVNYNAGGATNYFRFIYAQGEV